MADNWADLTDGTIDLTISVTENGVDIDDGAFDVWTNVNTAGARESTDLHCSDWNSTAGFGHLGLGEFTSSEWTDGSDGFCFSALHLYCFGQ